MKFFLRNGKKRLSVFNLLFALFLNIIPIVAVAADTHPEDFQNCNPSTGDDTACWQQAINSAKNSNSPYYFGTVAASSGKIYNIKNTLKICNTSGGTIDGHGAILRWSGPQTVPMFLVVNANQLKFTNFTIISNPSSPLSSAFEFTSARIFDDSCVGAQTAIPSSKNSIDHVTVEGTNTGGLLYGVRFTARYGRDENNDMSTIFNSTFSNVMNAAISIEHSQSHQHKLIAVNGYGALGNNGDFVIAETGFISIAGGYQGGWGEAVFKLNGSYGPFNITDINSEGSNRLLLVGNQNDVAGYPVTVNILGGRFAVNNLNSDGNLISFNRLGPLTVRGLRVDGPPPNGVKPAISFQPGQKNTTTAASIIVEGNSFYVDNADSNSWNTLIVKKFANLTSQGNLCFSQTAGQMVACLAPFRN